MHLVARDLQTTLLIAAALQRAKQELLAYLLFCGPSYPIGKRIVKLLVRTMRTRALENCSVTFLGVRPSRVWESPSTRLVR